MFPFLYLRNQVNITILESRSFFTQAHVPGAEF